MKWKTLPGTWKKLRTAAREMRREPTPAEERLWRELRRKSFRGQRFRRQHALGQFVVDFYCPALHLVVEVDGASHDSMEAQDRARDDFIGAMGIRVLRVKNEQVMKNPVDVIAMIDRFLGSGLPSLQSGEGSGEG